jgi:hypothetical protein
MHHLDNKAVYALALSMMTNELYIMALIAEIYDAEHNDRSITLEDVVRIRHTITIEYLIKIATTIICNKTAKPAPHGYTGTYNNP